MRYRLLDILRCPNCHGEFSITDIVEDWDADCVDGAFHEIKSEEFSKSRFFPKDDPLKAGEVCWRVEIRSAKLLCRDCQERFPVRDGIPDLLRSRDQQKDDNLADVKHDTMASFGFEWKQYRRYGWDQHDPSKEKPFAKVFADERRSFFTKSLAAGDEFEKKLVFDAGCGNGRYSLHARLAGAEVVGVDISDAVEVAKANLSAYPDVHIVRADLFSLPFAGSVFDRIFSIGVLMHTGDAHAAFHSLVKHLKAQGIISIHVYRRGNRIYEFLDRKIRKKTVTMKHEKLLKISRRAANFAKILRKIRFLTLGKDIAYPFFNCFIRLETHTHKVFDWYSAPVASHHTYEEVYEWFKGENVDVIGDRKSKKGFLAGFLRSPAGGVTVKGKSRELNQSQ